MPLRCEVARETRGEATTTLKPAARASPFLAISLSTRAAIGSTALRHRPPTPEEPSPSAVLLERTPAPPVTGDEQRQTLAVLARR